MPIFRHIRSIARLQGTCSFFALRFWESFTFPLFSSFFCFSDMGLGTISKKATRKSTAKQPCWVFGEFPVKHLSLPWVGWVVFVDFQSLGNLCGGFHVVWVVDLSGGPRINRLMGYFSQPLLFSHYVDFSPNREPHKLRGSQGAIHIYGASVYGGG